LPKTETVTVDLPTELLAQVRGAVEHGDYSSNDAVISDALLDWSDKRGGFIEDTDWLKQALQEADDHSGSDVPMEEVMDRLEAKYKALAAEGTGRK